jgi:hypothetical protein
MRKKRQDNYVVPGPDWLWCLDGHDKLSRFGIEIVIVVIGIRDFSISTKADAFQGRNSEGPNAAVKERCGGNTLGLQLNADECH